MEFQYMDLQKRNQKGRELHPDVPQKNRCPRRQNPKLQRHDEVEFDIKDFLSELRSLTPDERARLIRSYAN